MKSNFVKYIFVVFVIGIMGFAIYQLNKNEKKEEDVQQPVVEAEENEIIKEISLGVAEYDTINPILSKNKHIQEISKIIYDSLFEIDQEYKIKPNLIKDWAKTSEVTYLLKIKKDIKWSDGQSFTVDDVIYTIDVLKQIPSIYSYNVQYVIKTDKIDEETIQITIDHEIPFFEYNLIFPIISKEYYSGQDFSTTPKNDTTIGTGKYKIVENNNEVIKLIKNEHYREKELTLETINILKYATLGELYNSFKLGKVDILTTNNIGVQDNIGTIGYNIKEIAGREFDFLAINTQNAILSNKEVRQAIMCAINKENIVASLYKSKYVITNYPLDYGNWLKGEGTTYSYNPEQSKQILEQNGWEYKYNRWQKTVNYSTKSINLRLIVQASNPTRVTVAEMIKANLEEIGIKVSLVKAADGQYQSYLQNRNYDLIVTGVVESLSPNLDTFFGVNNLANYANEEIATIMNEVKNITKEELLKEKYARIKQIYNDEIPYIGLYNSYYAIASSWNLKGNISANWYNIFIDINNWYKE